MKSLSELFDEKTARDAKEYAIGFIQHDYRKGAQSVKPILLELDEALAKVLSGDEILENGNVAKKARAKLHKWLES